MRNLNQYVIERLKINKDIGPIKYNYQPKDYNELRSLLEQLLEERGPNADLNDIDVSQVTTFYNKDNDIGLFEKLDPHNIKIDKWDVSNVKSMGFMFYECKNFNCNLSKWNVRNVKNMRSMFYECENFDCDLSKWDVSNVTNITFMFNNCISLKNKPSWYKNKI